MVGQNKIKEAVMDIQAQISILEEQVANLKARAESAPGECDNAPAIREAVDKFGHRLFAFLTSNKKG